jgi:hypothetical protein
MREANVHMSQAAELGIGMAAMYMKGFLAAIEKE